MVFSFFKKQDKKMPERPAARPRAPDLLPEAKIPQPTAETPPAPLPEPLPDLEFTASVWAKAGPLPAADEPYSAAQIMVHPPLKPKAASADTPEFSIDDFDRDDFTESTVMGIDVDHDVDPMQACVEQVVVLYANGQDAAARSLLETFVRAYRGPEGKRFWLLLFDLLQVTGDRAGFDKLCVEYAETCEMSPPTWSSRLSAVPSASASPGPSKIFLQGVLTSEGALPVIELERLISQKVPVTVDCSKLIGCDDDVAGQLADMLGAARKARLSVTLGGSEGVINRLNARLLAGDAAHEPAWRLLLELLQRHGTQEEFEERAVDFAVTFELSPPSWETRPAAAMQSVAASTSRPADDAHYLSGELKGCRFDDLTAFLDAHEQPVFDFSGVRRLDFVSAGQLVNRLAPYKAAGRDIVIRSPNHLVAELMAVVGLNKQARILVPKS